MLSHEQRDLETSYCGTKWGQLMGLSFRQVHRWDEVFQFSEPIGWVRSSVGDNNLELEELALGSELYLVYSAETGKCPQYPICL